MINCPRHAERTVWEPLNVQFFKVLLVVILKMKPLGKNLLLL